jgi:hypothetical protein
MNASHRLRRILAWPVRLPQRLRDLEAAVDENRQLNRRIAELTDIVAELLVPATQRDEARLTELIQRYRDDALAP